MILIILATVCLTSAEHRQSAGANDGVKSIIYEIPDYEDPELTLFRMSAKGSMPFLTYLKVARESEDTSKEKDTTYYDDVRDGLDDAIIGLEVARSKLENGNINIFKDIDKSMHRLMKLEKQLQQEDVYPIDAAAYQPFVYEFSNEQPFALGAFSGQPLSYASVDFFSTSSGQPFDIEASSAQPYVSVELPLISDDSSGQPLDTKASSAQSYDSGDPSLSSEASSNRPFDTKASSAQSSDSESSSLLSLNSDVVSRVQSLTSDESTKHSPVSDAPAALSLAYESSTDLPLSVSEKFFASSENKFELEGEISSTHLLNSGQKSYVENTRHQKKLETQSGDDIFAAVSDKYEMGEKAAFRKKWSWKSSSLD